MKTQKYAIIAFRTYDTFEIRILMTISNYDKTKADKTEV